ncbi:DUF4232 domain-containing protein [Streptomyces sp. NBC_01465]|uniref:DUF4232 domain-containing protein n=1 Tax=Streptomyces sp. NBC_01465 TaxID=2903878 RepID=UPI002E3506CE|nr:DUF4232 domain-containing protein [Streptomyces sp. NBC_01465]
MRLIRTAALTATALLASIALTACGSSSDDATAAKVSDTASVPTSTDNKATDAAAKKQPTSKPTNESADTTPTAKPADNKKSTGTQQPTACTTTSIKLTASPITRPINHVLLTATNTGSKTCYLYYAPAIAFSDDAQSPLQVDKDTQPQAVVTLSPGQSGYAMIRTAGEDNGDKPYSTTQIRVNFQNRNDNGSVGAAAYAHLAKPLSVVDSQSAVTYWQSDVDAISAW